MLDKHVESAAVGHADDDFLDAVVAGTFKRQVQQRDQRFAAFEAEGLGPDEFALDKFFEDHRIGKAGEDADFFFAFELDGVLGRFHAALKPLTDIEVVDVHELGRHGTAVGVA